LSQILAPGRLDSQSRAQKTRISA